MANATKARSEGRNQGTPVSKEIKRAAARMAYAASVEEPEPETELERDDEELDVLRELAKAAEAVFFHEGPRTQAPTNVLVEALGAAADDFSTISMAEGAGSGVSSSAYRRAELRCQLAVALFEYRSEFGFREASERVVSDEGEVSP